MAQVNLNIDELKGFVNHIIKNNRFLQEQGKNPVAVEVVGESGIGKTSAVIDIAREIIQSTGSANVGVYIQATHGCCENRGIHAHSSLTQTTVLKGAFNDDPSTKKEFMDNIKMQQTYAQR